MGAVGCSAKENTADVDKHPETAAEFKAATEQKDETDSQSPPPPAKMQLAAHEPRRPSGGGAVKPRASLAAYLGDGEEMTLEQFNNFEANRNLVVWEHPTAEAAAAAVQAAQNMASPSLAAMNGL